MKWVSVRPGLSRLVEDSDPRPAIKLPKKKLGIPFTPYVPPWKQFEEGMLNPNSKNQAEYGDKFTAAREHEMRNDPKARKWEESRKERLAKDKPYFVKQIAREDHL